MGGAKLFGAKLPRGWRHYPARRESGPRSAKKLMAAIKGGKVSRVIILVRSNAHSDTQKVREMCRRWGVVCEFSQESPWGNSKR